MAASLECFPLRYASLSYTSDSDLELPQLSGSQTETENDTPPETPLRSRIPLKSSESCSCSKSDGSFVLVGLDVIGCSAAVPPPARIFQPLSLATPNPVRPSLNSFRSFGIANHDGDYGYDSEHEGRDSVRPLRVRSFRRGTKETSATSCDELSMKDSRVALSTIDKETRNTVSSPLSTPKLGGKPFQDASPSLPTRPRRPSPIETCSLDSTFQLITLGEDSVTRYSGAGSSRSMLSSVREMLAALDLDQEALRRGLTSTGVPFRLHKDRRNAATGLGLGWPSALPADDCRVPTVVPAAAIMLPKAPEIGPVEWETEDMSPLSLPLPMFSDSGSSYFDKSSFSVGDSSVTMESRILKLEV